MALPTYNKAQRRQSFEKLPKGAYVVTIKSAREDQNKNGNGSHLTIAFDIAEGEYKDYYKGIFERNSNEDKKWPNDGIFYLTVPGDGAAEYVFRNWNTFFADLEDSNNGFVFAGDVNTLKGKLIGAKMANEQTEYNGNIYDHMKMRWTCVAEDVRQGKAGSMPKDKLIEAPTTPAADNFVNIADEDLPF